MSSEEISFKEGNTEIWVGLRKSIVGTNPYLFVYGPAFMLYGSIFEILSTIFSSFVGVSCLAMALQGRLFHDFGWIFRIMTFMAGLFLVVPTFLTDLVGYGLLGIVVVHQIVTLPKGARIRL